MLVGGTVRFSLGYSVIHLRKKWSMYARKVEVKDALLLGLSEQFCYLYFYLRTEGQTMPVLFSRSKFQFAFQLLLIRAMSSLMVMKRSHLIYPTLNRGKCSFFLDNLERCCSSSSTSLLATKKTGSDMISTY